MPLHAYPPRSLTRSSDTGNESYELWHDGFWHLPPGSIATGDARQRAVALNMRELHERLERRRAQLAVRLGVTSYQTLSESALKGQIAERLERASLNRQAWTFGFNPGALSLSALRAKVHSMVIDGKRFETHISDGVQVISPLARIDSIPAPASSVPTPVQPETSRMDDEAWPHDEPYGTKPLAVVIASETGELM